MANRLISINAGIIGESVNLDLAHTQNVRLSQIVFELTAHLLQTQWRDPDDEPKLYLFGQLKRITRQWLQAHLKCTGNTYPAQLKYKFIADMACERITHGITRAAIQQGKKIVATLDPYNPYSSTAHVRFNTTKLERYETDSRRCHINWVILDSDWEAEFCRVAEAHPRVKAYVKNHNLGFEVPYRYGAEMRTYLPDFIVLVDDGHGDENPLHLIVEIKGYRGEDAKVKKNDRGHLLGAGREPPGPATGAGPSPSSPSPYQLPGRARSAHRRTSRRRRFLTQNDAVTDKTHAQEDEQAPWPSKNHRDRHQNRSSIAHPRPQAEADEHPHGRAPADAADASVQDPDPRGLRASQPRPRSRSSSGAARTQQDWSDLVVQRAAAVHPGKGAPQGAHRRPAVNAQQAGRGRRPSSAGAADCKRDLFADFNGVEGGDDSAQAPSSTSTMSQLERTA